MPAQVFSFGIKQFQKHMRSKENFWNPLTTHIGDDFAVFSFDFKYQADNAFQGCGFWVDSYNYSLKSDGDKKFVIINKTVKPDTHTSTVLMG